MPVRKISRAHQDLIDVIYRVADAIKLNDINYDITGGNDEIDSFLDGIYKVEIKGYRDRQKISKSVLVKWHIEPTKRLLFREAYQREFMFYKQILPKLLDFQRSHHIIEGLKTKFPNCVFASKEYDKETTVVLSLQEHGFRFHDRFHDIDQSHAALVLKNLAKIHALSFVYEKTYSEEFEDIKRICGKDVQYSNPNDVSRAVMCCYKTAVKVVSDPVAKEKLNNLAPKILLVLNKCTTPIDSYNTLCHGDCWNNNILFKYKRNRPVDVIFIDYQLVRYASPVTDIAYFVYMSCGREFLSKHYDQAMDIYYGTLAAVLRQCQLDVQEVYPRHIFQKHLEQYSVFGLLEALMSMKIITADTEEAIKMTEEQYQFSSESNDLLCEALPRNKSLYVQRINSVVDNFFSRNYSLDALLS